MEGKVVYSTAPQIKDDQRLGARGERSLDKVRKAYTKKMVSKIFAIMAKNSKFTKHNV